ncbi:class I SAM-dependent methyltransferase [Inquilinus limosus]|uniref:Methyltransferase type 11 domain-containing protein n=1 Tax=Inquilinus limosus TaxID=171674 RepID=A0A211YWU0_9PROT|nr:methyltransferase domain-containing protein [Inquilinus limosus]OWJ57421.1 hypothetical protein BWR60_34265 [Inquilinus limosus]
MDLAERWEAQARQWIRWARQSGHDSYWLHHRDQFLQLLPPPGRLTVDIGCGEGRLTRHLKGLGHRITGIDASPTLVAAARQADPAMDVRLANATALPLAAPAAVPAHPRPPGLRVRAKAAMAKFISWLREVFLVWRGPSLAPIQGAGGHDAAPCRAPPCRQPRAMETG